MPAIGPFLQRDRRVFLSKVKLDGTVIAAKRKKGMAGKSVCVKA